VNFTSSANDQSSSLMAHLWVVWEIRVWMSNKTRAKHKDRPTDNDIRRAALTFTPLQRLIESNA